MICAVLEKIKCTRFLGAFSYSRLSAADYSSVIVPSLLAIARNSFRQRRKHKQACGFVTLSYMIGIWISSTRLIKSLDAAGHRNTAMLFTQMWFVAGWSLNFAEMCSAGLACLVQGVLSQQ